MTIGIFPQPIELCGLEGDITTGDRRQALSPRAKLAFSVESRLRSLIGQYGGMSNDVLRAVAPYVTDHEIDICDAPDHEVMGAIRLIRSKLMP